MKRALILEIMRFLVVGGLAFIVDFSVLSLFVKYFFHTDQGWRLYLATALGFLAGVGINYVLSILFVFQGAKKRLATRPHGVFPAFISLGFIGFLLTEGGMYLDVGVLAINYQIAKILVTGIVLVWNYLSRKLIIFQPKKERREVRWN